MHCEKLISLIHIKQMGYIIYVSVSVSLYTYPHAVRRNRRSHLNFKVSGEHIMLPYQIFKTQIPGWYHFPTY
jgi:hypothetical protein